MQHSEHASRILSHILQLGAFCKISQFLFFFPTVSTETQTF